MRLAFLGTPDFAVPVLAALLAQGDEIRAVYCQPPRRTGRGQQEKRAPVHAFAARHDLDIRTPVNFKDETVLSAFEMLDLDAAIVVAYGLILPSRVLSSPRFGCLNLHASLLPRWRGAAPIQRAIMAGDTVTGIQVMQMEAGLDTGPIMKSQRVPITPQETAQTLHDKLAQIGARLLPQALSDMTSGDLLPVQQSTKGIRYAHKLTAGDTRMDWSLPCTVVDCHIRGLSPFPGAWFQAIGQDGKCVRIKALISRPIAATVAGKAGEVLNAENRLIVACGTGAVDILQLQRAGKSVQDAAEFLRGFPIRAGDCLPLPATSL